MLTSIAISLDLRHTFLLLVLAIPSRIMSLHTDADFHTTILARVAFSIRHMSMTALSFFFLLLSRCIGWRSFDGGMFDPLYVQGLGRCTLSFLLTIGLSEAVASI